MPDKIHGDVATYRAELTGDIVSGDILKREEQLRHDPREIQRIKMTLETLRSLTPRHTDAQIEKKLKACEEMLKRLIPHT